jgi:hypothetical protein
MEAVHIKENILRGNAPTAVNARLTHCRRGHLLAGSNLRLDGNKRSCRACKCITQNARRAKRRAARIEAALKEGKP